MLAWWLDRMTQTSNSSTSHVESESSLQSPHLNSWYGHMVNAHWCPHSKTSLLHWVQFFYNACMKFSIFLLVMLLQPDCSEDFSHLLGLTVPFLVVSVAHLPVFINCAQCYHFFFIRQLLVSLVEWLLPRHGRVCPCAVHMCDSIANERERTSFLVHSHTQLLILQTVRLSSLEVNIIMLNISGLDMNIL